MHQQQASSKGDNACLGVLVGLKGRTFLNLSRSNSKKPKVNYGWLDAGKEASKAKPYFYYFLRLAN